MVWWFTNLVYSVVNIVHDKVTGVALLGWAARLRLDSNGRFGAGGPDAASRGVIGLRREGVKLASRHRPWRRHRYVGSVETAPFPAFRS